MLVMSSFPKPHWPDRLVHAVHFKIEKLILKGFQVAPMQSHTYIFHTGQENERFPCTLGTG